MFDNHAPHIPASPSNPLPLVDFMNEKTHLFLQSPICLLHIYLDCHMFTGFFFSNYFKYVTNRCAMGKLALYFYCKQQFGSLGITLYMNVSEAIKQPRLVTENEQATLDTHQSFSMA